MAKTETSLPPRTASHLLYSYRSQQYMYMYILLYNAADPDPSDSNVSIWFRDKNSDPDPTYVSAAICKNLLLNFLCFQCFYCNLTNNINRLLLEKVVRTGTEQTVCMPKYKLQ